MKKERIYSVEKALSYVSHRVLNFDDIVIAADDPIRLLKGFVLTPSNIRVYFSIKDYMLIDKVSVLGKFLKLHQKSSGIDDLNDKEHYIHDYFQHCFQEYYDQFLMEDVLI